MRKSRIIIIIVCSLFLVGIRSDAGDAKGKIHNVNRIRPYAKNPYYWQYKGKPVLLLGGSKDDNLFQIPDLKEHIDLLASVGGNYIRNTMSARVDKGFEVQAFKRLPDGKYDLNHWNDEYWNRFERMLKLTGNRDIIVQIEVWAFHDFNIGHWEKNPWHPANNTCYDSSNTTLKEVYGNIGKVPHDFFFTVPKLKNDRDVLRFQQKFVDKLLSYSLRYGHVLYCMTNEIHPQFSPEWGWYWSQYIKDKAAAAHRKVETTEMYWEIDLKKAQQRASLDRPEVFSFFEASQNSAKMDRDNGDNLCFAYDYLAEEPRPINHVKIYGADTSTWKGSTDRHASECFWRNIMGGSASSRFHRPPYGLGLSKKAQAHIKSMRMITDELDIFMCAPHNDLLSDRIPNEAYCLANPGKEYAVYFPNGGDVVLDISSLKSPATIRWLEISTSKWGKQQELKPAQSVALRPPGSDPWAALLVRQVAATGTPAGDVTFTRVDLATQEDHSWGDVQVGDLNGDGKLDIQAGKQWYEGPDWVRHSFGPNPGNIYGTGQCLLYDVDGDGDLDILGYLRGPYRYCWFENPGPPSTGPWALHIIGVIRKGWPEGKCIVDLDGDGKDELIALEKDGTGIQRAEIPSKPKGPANWKFTQISSASGHGLAIGDLNEDGRPDIVADYTWLEQRAGGGWARHDIPQRPRGQRATETTSPLIADLDGDGDKDLFLPRAHNYGAYWLESSGGSSPTFKLHEVLHDQLPSQFYGAAYGDIDGDGDMDVFGGQCHYSHQDPGESDPPDVFWIESVPSGVSGRVTWVKHQLSTQLKMGRCPSIADLDGDGNMDLVMRPIGFGGYRELNPKGQYDVTIFFQNVSVTATTELTAKSAAWRQPNDSGTQSSGNENATSAQTIQAPYPSSQVVRAMRLDWATHLRYAQGSGNFQLTWADANHLYGAWGDGKDFDGTNADGRVSLGVARVEGPWNNYK